MTQRRRRFALLLAVGTLLLPPGLPAPGTAAATRPPAPGPNVAADARPAVVGPEEPGPDASVAGASLHATTAARYARQRFSFPAGDRVSVGFVPRPGDRATVGGRRPRPLPAGRLSGADLRAGLPTRSDPSPDPTGRAAVEGGPTGPGAAVATATATATPSTAPTPTPPPSTSPSSSPTTAPSASSSPTPTVTPSPSPRPTLAPRTDGPRRTVYGFLPYWFLGDTDTRLDYASLSTIAYFGVGADAQGRLVRTDANGRITNHWAGWTSANLTRIIDEAHRNGVRVALTVERFSWTAADRDVTIALLSDAARRQNLAREIAQAVRDRGVDGVNLDFEPIPSAVKAQFVTFTREVRAALDAQAPGYELTLDSTGYIGSYDVRGLTAPGAADAIMIMGYGYSGPGNDRAGSTSPLNGPYYNQLETLDRYLALTSPDKLILGVAWYGEASSTVDDGLNALRQTDTVVYGGERAIGYATTRGLLGRSVRRWDPYALSPYLVYRYRHCTTCPETWRQAYVEDESSLALKYDAVNRRGLRGVGIWALGTEGTYPEPAQLLRHKFVADTTPPTVAIEPLPETLAHPELSVRWSGWDDWSGVASYDVEVSTDAGPWEPWQTATAATSATYLARDGHDLRFRVRARDGAGNVGTWSELPLPEPEPTLGPGRHGRVVAPSLSLRATPSTTAVSLRTLIQGQLVEVLEGPVADGDRLWYRVAAPVASAPTDPILARIGGWVSGRNGSYVNVAPARSPVATRFPQQVLLLALEGVDVGPDGTVSGEDVSEPRPRVFSPEGDGVADRLRVAFRLLRPLAGVEVRLLDADTGAAVHTAALGSLAATEHAWTWDGLDAAASPVADGTLIVHVVGSDPGGTYGAPAATLDGAEVDLSAATVRLDRTRPAVSVTSPAQDLGIVGRGPFELAWEESDEGTGVAERVVVPEHAPLGETGCGDTWETATGTGGVTSPWTSPPLEEGRCHRVRLRLSDAAGNAAEAISPVVRVRPAPPALAFGTPESAAAIVVDDATWFDAARSGQIRLPLTSTLEGGSMSDPAIDLGAAVGWRTVTAPTAEQPWVDLAWDTGASDLTVTASVADGGGGRVTASTALRADRVGPAIGGTSLPAARVTTIGTSSAVIDWTEVDTSDGSAPGVGVKERTVVREQGRSISRGSCADVTWAAGDVSSLPAPRTDTDLADATCYRWRVRARDAFGHLGPPVVIGPVAVDLLAPVGTLIVSVPGADPAQSPGLFSPDGDGRSDTLRARWRANRGVTAVVSIRSGTTLRLERSFASFALEGTWTWDGRDAAGTPVPDGRYQLTLRVTDRLGRVHTSTAGVSVERIASAPAVAPALWYPQDGDRLAASTVVRYTLARTARVTLEFLDLSGRVVRRAYAGRALAAGTHTLRWDGRDAAGVMVPIGRYAARISVTTGIGRTVHASGMRLSAFQLALPAGGFRAGVPATLRITSAERLAALPSVRAIAGGTVVARVTATSTGGLGYRTTLTLPAGTVELAVSATDAGGRTNRYRLRITVAP